MIKNKKLLAVIFFLTISALAVKADAVDWSKGGTELFSNPKGYVYPPLNKAAIDNWWYEQHAYNEALYEKYKKSDGTYTSRDPNGPEAGSWGPDLTQSYMDPGTSHPDVRDVNAVTMGYIYAYRAFKTEDTAKAALYKTRARGGLDWLLRHQINNANLNTAEIKAIRVSDTNQQLSNYVGTWAQYYLGTAPEGFVSHFRSTPTAGSVGRTLLEGYAEFGDQKYLDGATLAAKYLTSGGSYDLYSTLSGAGSTGNGGPRFLAEYARVVGNSWYLDKAIPLVLMTISTQTQYGYLDDWHTKRMFYHMIMVSGVMDVLMRTPTTNPNYAKLSDSVYRGVNHIILHQTYSNGGVELYGSDAEDGTLTTAPNFSDFIITSLIPATKSIFNANSQTLSNALNLINGLENYDLIQPRPNGEYAHRLQLDPVNSAYMVWYVRSSTSSSTSDTTPPAISITCPSPGTYSSQTISASGTASDDKGVSKIEVKVGSAGTYKTATGTTSWSVSGLTLASGANAVYARATDSSGNTKETTISVTYNPSATTKPAIGNWGYGVYGYLSFQDDPKLTWDETVSLNSMRSGVTNILQIPIYSSYGPTMDFTFIQKRFDLATANKDKPWQYGGVLLLEELFHPSARAAWYPATEGLAKWPIDNTATFAGVTIMQLKPWYTQKYGSWNQAWWDGVKASNAYDDPKVMAWSAYFGRQLLEAWNNHMHNLGKKSALIGVVGIPPGRLVSGMADFEFWSEPSPMWQYLVQSYDAIFAYQYPENLDQVKLSVDVAKQFREKYNFKGKLIWVLTSVWPGGTGSGDEAVQQAEFNAVAPYVDAIIGFPYVYNDGKAAANTPYPPRLIKFWEQYGGTASGNPAPTCTAPATNSCPLLQIGSTGADVSRLQALLKARGADINIDGVFGEYTLSVVKSAQTSLGLTPDGIVGKTTWAALGEVCAPSSQSSITSLTLKPGWNQISSPLAAGINLAAIESSCTILPYKTYKLWGWNAQTQTWINPAKVEPFKGHWIYAAYQCTVPLSGTSATFTSLQLYNGWNKISASGTFSAIQGTCTGHITGNWVWHWDKTTEKWIHPATMQLDKGYWIKVDQNCVLSA